MSYLLISIFELRAPPDDRSIGHSRFSYKLLAGNQMKKVGETGADRELVPTPHAPAAAFLYYACIIFNHAQKFDPI